MYTMWPSREKWGKDWGVPLIPTALMCIMASFKAVGTDIIPIASVISKHSRDSEGGRRKKEEIHFLVT